MPGMPCQFDAELQKSVVDLSATPVRYALIRGCKLEQLDMARSYLLSIGGSRGKAELKQKKGKQNRLSQ